MLKSLDDPRTAGLILEEQANALKSILGDASVLKLVRVSSLFIYLFIRLISQENGNVSWQRCAQMLLNNWLDQWQSGESVLSMRFSVVNWCSRPVAKSAYCVRQEEPTLLISRLRLGMHCTASFGLPLWVFGPSFIHNLITHVCETRTKHSNNWSSIIVASTLYKPLVITSLWFYLFIFVRD